LGKIVVFVQPRFKLYGQVLKVLVEFAHLNVALGQQGCGEGIRLQNTRRKNNNNVGNPGSAQAAMTFFGVQHVFSDTRNTGELLRTKLLVQTKPQS
jgi:hypothetical protein